MKYISRGHFSEKVAKQIDYSDGEDYQEPLPKPCRKTRWKVNNIGDL